MIIQENNIFNNNINITLNREEFIDREYKSKILEIRRVSKVVKGGKIFKFRVSLVTGNYNGKVGFGIGKSDETNIAIQKAILDSKKNLIDVKLNSNKSINNIINFSNASCKIFLKPAFLGTGIKAGSSIKTVLELAGIQNIIAKRLGSSNLLNNAKTTIKALKSIN
jgi:small subunit ribosomal protein S5